VSGSSPARCQVRFARCLIVFGERNLGIVALGEHEPDAAAAQSVLDQPLAQQGNRGACGIRKLKTACPSDSAAHAATLALSVPLTRSCEARKAPE
jgi:hypothetical protein